MTVATVGFTNVFDELKTEALNIWENLKAAGEAEVATVASALGPVVKSEVAEVLSQLKTLALNTVVSLAQTEFENLTGGQKHSITTNTIMQAALASGKQLALQDAATLAQGAFDALASTAPSH